MRNRGDVGRALGAVVLSPEATSEHHPVADQADDQYRSAFWQWMSGPPSGQAPRRA